MNPFEALDIHLGQWEWSDTPGRLESEYEKIMSGQRFESANGYTPDTIAYYANRERTILNEAKTVYITDEMLSLAYYMARMEFTVHNDHVIEYAMPDGLNRDELAMIADGYRHAKPYDLWLDTNAVPVLRQEMLPLLSGMLIFEGNYPYADYDEQLDALHPGDPLPHLPLKAIAWGPASHVAVYNDDDNLDDIFQQKALNNTAPGICVYCYVATEHVPLASHWQKTAYGSASPLTMIDFAGWAFNNNWQVGTYASVREGHEGAHGVRPHVAGVRYLLSAVWGLMNSYLVTQRPTRQQQKRMKRSKMPEDGDISVIHLRKFLSVVKSEPAQDYDEDGEPVWTHRWIVRGHWAWRACRCPEHEGRHRVYIDPYIKGPEHLPLVIKEKVLSIDR